MAEPERSNGGHHLYRAEAVTALRVIKGCAAARVHAGGGGRAGSCCTRIPSCGVAHPLCVHGSWASRSVSHQSREPNALNDRVTDSWARMRGTFGLGVYSPFTGRRSAAGTVAGYVPIPLTSHDYLLLPVRWQAITAAGIRIHHRTDGADLLAPYRGRPSPVEGRGKWEIHYNPHDVFRHTKLPPADALGPGHGQGLVTRQRIPAVWEADDAVQHDPLEFRSRPGGPLPSSPAASTASRRRNDDSVSASRCQPGSPPGPASTSKATGRPVGTRSCS
ncbi:hypothetical protein [Streptomyces virginiae]|uniref:hypothetical protein n=1 Tax=Streptomyces virginiae TaxID=1961 RepID=UPI0037033325